MNIKVFIFSMIFGLAFTGAGAFLLYRIFSGKTKPKNTRYGLRVYGSLIVLAFVLTIGGIAWLILTFVDPYWLSSA